MYLYSRLHQSQKSKLRLTTNILLSSYLIGYTTSDNRLCAVCLQVININSLGGHRVGPNTDLHFYAASKFALTALTDGLRQELATDPPTKIRVAVRSKHPVLVSHLTMNTKVWRINKLSADNWQKDVYIFECFRRIGCYLPFRADNVGVDLWYCDMIFVTSMSINSRPAEGRYQNLSILYFRDNQSESNVLKNVFFCLIPHFLNKQFFRKY